MIDRNGLFPAFYLPRICAACGEEEVKSSIAAPAPHGITTVFGEDPVLARPSACRPITTTVLSDGQVTIEVGDETLKVSENERATLVKALTLDLRRGTP